MKFCKELILVLFFFASPHFVEAERAYTFGTHYETCVDKTFTINSANFSFFNVSGLSTTAIGWRRLDGSAYPSSGDVYSAYIVVRSEGDTAVFWSKQGTKNYYDTIYIAAVQKPFIEIYDNDTTLCNGESILAVTDVKSNADEVIWDDLATMKRYKEGELIILTQSTIFTVTARSRVCDPYYHSIRYEVTVKPTADTSLMNVQTPSEVDVCQGCSHNLTDLLEFDHVDSYDLSSLAWTLNGSPYSATTVKMPPSPLGDVYEATLSGELYSSNDCGVSSVILKNFKAKITVRPSTDCKLQSRWASATGKSITEEPCQPLYFQVVNPQRINFVMGLSDIRARSKNGSLIAYEYDAPSGGKQIYRFRYEPKDDDTIYIEADYLNNCNGGNQQTYYDTLYYKADIRLFMQSTYCIGDTLDLFFTCSNTDLFIKSVTFEPVQGFPTIRYQDSFHLVYPPSSPIQEMHYRYKDSIQDWGIRPNIPIKIAYSSCGVSKELDTILVPRMSDDCYPRVAMLREECKGDTCLIMIQQKRLPEVYVKSLEWDFPPDLVQWIGYCDTIYSWDSTEMRYLLKIVSYSTDPIRYRMQYSEKGPITPIDNPVKNLTKTTCYPDLGVEVIGLCRGQETDMELHLRNKNGRMLSADFELTTGKKLSSVLVQSKFENSADTAAVYYYKLRAQGSGQVRYKIEYSFGDSTRTHEGTSPDEMILDDCFATIKQPLNPNKSYCFGEKIILDIIPADHSEYEIDTVFWESPEWLPIEFDSRLSGGGVRYIADIKKDTAAFDLTLKAKIEASDYFGDPVENYELTDEVSIHPYPKLYNTLYIDVCETAAVDLEDYFTDLAIEGAWIDPVNWSYTGGRYPNQGPDVNIAQGEPTEKKIYTTFQTFSGCAFLRNSRFTLDSIILRWNSPDALSFTEPFKPICVNDTLHLNEYLYTDRSKPVSWLRYNVEGGKIDTLHWNAPADSNLTAIVSSGSAHYVALKNTVCSDPEPRDTQELIPTEAPILESEGDRSVCLYDSATFYLKPNPDIDPGTVVWYLPQGQIDNSQVKVYISDESQFYATVMARAKDANCWGKDTIHFTPWKLPEVTVKVNGGSNDTMRCEKVDVGEDFNLQVIAGGGVEYTWLLPDSGVKTNPLQVKPVIDTTTIYRVQGIDANGCKNTASFYIAIIQSENFKDTGLCANSSFEISASEKKDMKYLWQKPDGTTLSERTLQLNSLSKADSGTYKLIRNLYGCLLTDSFTLRTKVVPKAEISETNSPLCENTLLRLIPKINEKEARYYWQTPGGQRIKDSVHIENVRLSDAGQYQLFADLENCLDSVRWDVRVDPRTTNLNIKNIDPFYCDKDSVFWVFEPDNVDSFRLKMPGKPNFVRVANNSKLQVNYPNDSGEVVLIAYNRTCQDIQKLALDVRYRPISLPVPEKTQYCTGDTIRITVVPEQDATYLWKFPSGEDRKPTLELKNVDPTLTGTYQLTASLNGCQNSYELTLTVNPLPVLKLHDTTLCTPKDSVLIDAGARPNASYRWSSGEQTPSIIVHKGDIYTVTVTENACSKDGAANVKESQKPVFDFGYTDTMVCFGTEVILHIGAENYPSANYYWEQTGENSKSITVSEAGIYTLTIEENDCFWTDQIRLINKFCGALHFPTAFRPSSTIETNRTFRPFVQTSKDLLLYEMFIYDKWGNLIFQTSDIEEGWDGTHQGKPCNPSTYVYVVRASEKLQGTDLSTRGTVALIR